jgi:hypothetical protein
MKNKPTVFQTFGKNNRTDFVVAPTSNLAKKRAKHNSKISIVVPADMVPDEDSFVVEESGDCSFEG